MANVYVNIDPEDFLNECSRQELKEIFNILISDYDFSIISEETEKEDVRSESHRRFLYYLLTLKESWTSVTNEDAQIISILAKKYGAV